MVHGPADVPLQVAAEVKEGHETGPVTELHVLLSDGLGQKRCQDVYVHRDAKALVW